MSNHNMLKIKEQIESLSIEIKDTKKNHILCLGLKRTTHISGMTSFTLCLGQGAYLSLELPYLLFSFLNPACPSGSAELSPPLGSLAWLPCPSSSRLPTPQHSHSTLIILSSVPPHPPNVKAWQRDCVLSQAWNSTWLKISTQKNFVE